MSNSLLRSGRWCSPSSRDDYLRFALKKKFFFWENYVIFWGRVESLCDLKKKFTGKISLPGNFRFAFTSSNVDLFCSDNCISISTFIIFTWKMKNVFQKRPGRGRLSRHKNTSFILNTHSKIQTEKMMKKTFNWNYQNKFKNHTFSREPRTHRERKNERKGKK